MKCVKIALLFFDAKAKPTKPEQCRQLIELPFTSAKELGTALMKNMVLCSNMCNHGFRYCNI